MTQTQGQQTQQEQQAQQEQISLNPEQREVLIRKLTALADDEIVLAHRDSEWTGHAPILEEDIALANIAQDELGHALMYLELRAELDGSNPDQLAMFREAAEYTNVRLVELPKGDWALSMLRQFLYDSYEALWQESAAQSTHAGLAAVAAKALREEKFHLQHTALWVERLALGTAESKRRIQEALNVLWPYTAQLFEPVIGEELLVAAGIVPDLAEVRTRWEALVTAHLTKCELQIPEMLTSEMTETEGGRERHTEHLAELLTEMQSVAREYADADAW